MGLLGLSGHRLRAVVGHLDERGGGNAVADAGSFGPGNAAGDGWTEIDAD